MKGYYKLTSCELSKCVDVCGRACACVDVCVRVDIRVRVRVDFPAPDVSTHFHQNNEIPITTDPDVNFTLINDCIRRYIKLSFDWLIV